MVNNMHPKELAPLSLETLLHKKSGDLYPVDEHGSKTVISDPQKKVLDKFISGYRYRSGFTDKLKGFVYRIVQAVKAIFGKSDWNKALNTLMTFHLDKSDKLLNQNRELDEINWIDTQKALTQAKDDKTLSPEEYNRFMNTHTKVKKTFLNYLMSAMTKSTRVQVARPAGASEKPDLKELENSLDRDLKAEDQEILGKSLNSKWNELLAKLRGSQLESAGEAPSPEEGA